MTGFATTLRERLGLADPVPVAFQRGEVVAGDGFDRERIDQVVAKVGGDFITELRVERGHALDMARFDATVEWIVERVSDP